MYAIARVSKIKSIKHLKAAGAHNTRGIPTPNSSGEADKVVILAGSRDPAADVIELLPRGPDGQVKVRKNGVWAMEHLLTASPEYFRPDQPEKAGIYDQSRMEAWRDKTMQWLRERYGENLASAVLHLDESTPHIQALIVPRRSDGKLDAASLFGPEQLRDMQTSYAQALSDLGLKRGIEGSKAKHQTVKKFYALANAPILPDAPKITTAEPRPLPKKKISEYIPLTDKNKARKAAEEDYQARKARRRAEIEAYEAYIIKNAPILAAKAKMHDATLKAAASREAAVEQLREQSARLRDIPLDRIFELFGSRPDRRDKKNWATCAGRISVNGEKFFNHDANIGGGGAIDLTMHLGNMTYKDAVAFLGKEIGSDAALSAALSKAHTDARAAVSSPAPSKIPAFSTDPAHINSVRSYLVDERKISKHLVDWLIKRGDVGAVSVGNYINAAFKLDKGVELRGISGKYHGVRGEKGLFVIEMKNPKKVVFVESAIEAMSYITLVERNRWESVKVISTTGSSSWRLKDAILRELNSGMEVVLAFNSDGKGPNQTNLGEISARVSVEKPPYGVNDWNDWLRDGPQILAEMEAKQKSKAHGASM